MREPTEMDKLALMEAQRLIERVPDLWFVVGRVVGSIVPLGNVDDGFDVSHSEPALGEMVLLSIPRHTPLTGLRVAEGVVHEAMHLNLSSNERLMPLVESADLMFSPWRSTLREAGGVLHGLYVFCCIARFMQYLLVVGKLSTVEKLHACLRLKQISSDLAKVDLERLVASLTTEGNTFANELLSMSKTCQWSNEKYWSALAERDCRRPVGDPTSDSPQSHVL